MRVLKFRAWDKTNKKMLDRVIAGPGDPCSLAWSEDKGWNNFDDDCGEIMQFTGLLDKNGKEIYEGDILLYPYAVTLVDQHVWPHKTIAIPAEDHKLGVSWKDGSFILVDYPRADWLLLGIANIKEMEVIGNIWEHPELIKDHKA